MKVDLLIIIDKPGVEEEGDSAATTQPHKDPAPDKVSLTLN